ncbi:DUF4282 domain-containing protein [Salmonella enterica subsp. enterica serovar Mikawasima]|nr:DUF4282 domain-containing protein [Salmonella enterica subsp. enterica serovar Mikawasima]ECD9545544.1 DUF4282 domain-containing protein [Salmonella enterica subsp. houtenae]EJP1982758.1 DUF4282 domain-containing protein [Salmonella enterica]ECA9211800.1 DUF4282 domain-containing protein [Salmonella enterica subsp. enterica serovar Mikawasima]ECE5924966.1 hypothetical protein [Salmonella enterica subsp. houtenae]
MLLKFDSLITPKLLKVLYALATLGCIVMVLLSFDTRPHQAVIWLIVAAAVRIPFELMMVAFKNNEYLRRICELMERNNSNFKDKDFNAGPDADFKD